MYGIPEGVVAEVSEFEELEQTSNAEEPEQVADINLSIPSRVEECFLTSFVHFSRNIRIGLDCSDEYGTSSTNLSSKKDLTNRFVEAKRKIN